MVTISAPGKVMLMGEHAVVYGHPCLVTAVDQRLNVTIEKTSGTDAHIDAPQVKDTRFVESAIEKARSLWHIPVTGLSIHTESPFSGVFGFGSSSAVTVATLRAIAAIHGLNVTDREIFDAAYDVVLTVQTVGSGFDVAAATYGGTLYFIGGGSTIEPLPITDIPLVIGYSGIKSNTVDIVKDVADKKKKYPEKIERIFGAIHELVDQGKEALLRSDWERLGKLFDYNQEYLRDLGVSCQKLEDLILAAKKAGAFGAKLSGAGGGDCIIALAPGGKQQAVRNAIESAGGQVIDVRAHAHGVQIDLPAGRQETTDDQQELFIVVDKDDNVLGYRTRYDCHHDKTLMHRTVGAIVFDKNGSVLLQKRSSTKDMDAGLWGISCAGHVRKGQSYEEALHREFMEELGVDIQVEPLATFIAEDEHETEMSALYKGVSDGPFVPNPEETERLCYFSPREISFKVASREIILSKCAEISLRKAGVLR